MAAVEGAKPAKFGSTVKKPTASAEPPKTAKKEAVKSAKPAKEKKESNLPRREKAFKDDMVIKCQVKENPFRATLAERFDNILSAKGKYTVADYVEATDRYSDLAFFVGKEVISIS